jgi:thiol-disulfide isomerase/thioredoxin
MYYRLLLLLTFVSFSATVAAQKQPKTTQKEAQPNIDYKQMGAPMPQLVFMAYHDTAAANKIVEKKEKKKRRRRSSVPPPVSNEQYTVMTDKDLDNGANLFVMMFNPTCSHCEEMTLLMTQNIKSFNKTKVVLLATQPMAAYIPDFAERRELWKYPPMYIGYDSAGFVENVILYQQLPQINVYNSNRKLIKSFSGEVPIDTLKKFIE